MTMKNMSMTQATIQVQKSNSSKAALKGSSSRIKNDMSPVHAIAQTLKGDAEEIVESTVPAAGESNIPAITNAMNAFDSGNSTAGTYKDSLITDAERILYVGTSLDIEDQALGGNS